MKVRELIEKLQKLNPEHDVKVVAYNENAECSKKCNVTGARESFYYKNVNDNEFSEQTNPQSATLPSARLYHYVILNYSFED